jgi:lysophospholipase L1-like esterase
MNTIFNYKPWSLIALLVILVSCEPDIDIPAPQTGSADFSRYIAVGNSLTAGISDNGLYLEAQQNSFPAIIARQISEISPITFNQPLMPPGNGTGHIFLAGLDGGNPQLGIRPPDPNAFNKVNGDFNNLGIPFLRVKDIGVQGLGANPAAGSVNAFFYRMLGENESNKSYIQKVAESNPTFFTCWLGNNDVLGYATSGGAFGIEGRPGTNGLNGLTEKELFQLQYNQLVNALTSNGAKGLLLTIPNITSIPYFTVVPWNGLALSANEAAQANAAYAEMIDPQVAQAVKVNVITIVVTETALKENVTPALSQQAVFQQAVAAALAQGATQEEAEQIAQNYLASTEGQQAVADLKAQLDSVLQAHLTGGNTPSELAPLLLAIDQQLATNTALQQGIAAGVEQTLMAYDNEALPPAQQTQLRAVITVTTAQQITALKAAGIYPTFQQGPNPFVMETAVTVQNPLGIRQLRQGEYILLSALADGQLAGQAAVMPKANQYVLDAAEVANVDEYRAFYNNVISTAANNSPNIALVDADQLLQKYNAGVFVDGVQIDGRFIQGGLFSLDGVHLTPRGYAATANEIITVINRNFNASIPPAVVNNFRAVVLP